MFLSSFLIVFVVLFVAWVVGFAFHLLGGLIHLFLLVPLISLAVHFARGIQRPHRWSAPHCAAHWEELRVSSGRSSAGLRIPSAEWGARVL